MTTTVYLIRHGETTWNRIGRLQGHSDSPLTLRGTRQNESIGRALKGLTKDTTYRFWASPLGRAQQSAAIISDIIGCDYHNIRFDKRLVEITLGDRDGYSSWKALANDFPEEVKIRENDPWNFCHPNGESSQLVQDRVKPILEEWVHMGGIHIVVSHGVVIKILRGLHLNLTPSETFALDRPQEAFHKLIDNGIEIIPVKVKTKK